MGVKEFEQDIKRDPVVFTLVATDFLEETPKEVPQRPYQFLKILKELAQRKSV